MATPIILDGKKLADELKLQLATQTTAITASGKRAPHLAAILVGNDGGSLSYIGHKVKACEQVGFKSTLLHIEDTSITEQYLLNQVLALNADDTVDGFIVQLPLPRHINADKVLLAIDPRKDVDGFHPVNVGKLALGMPTYISATPMGIIALLDKYEIETAGKHCVIIGRSNIVGRPLSILLSQNSSRGNATVTICHSKTQDIKSYTLQADIIVAALGQPRFLTADMVRPGAVIIDVGTTRVQDPTTKTGWKLQGDVDYEQVAPIAAAITPVPGGVGPLTVISLLMNTLKAYQHEV
jgi:methylenetetrahydrofolate dehydrogenase (NADP+) / methenyltetrahydrofolate cyclohydrolase